MQLHPERILVAISVFSIQFRLMVILLTVILSLFETSPVSLKLSLKTAKDNGDSGVEDIVVSGN